jgi:hypothetical protein
MLSVAHAVICLPVIAGACIPSEISLCGIYGGHRRTGTGLSRGTLALIHCYCYYYYYSTNTPCLFVYLSPTLRILIN